MTAHFSKHPSRHLCVSTQDVPHLPSSPPRTIPIPFLPALLGFVVLEMEAKASHTQGKISAIEQDPRLIFHFNATLFPWKPGCL